MNAKRAVAPYESFRAEPSYAPPTMTVMRGLHGPVLRLLSAEGEVALRTADVDALIRLARANEMTS
jgi:hypothetical protein